MYLKYQHKPASSHPSYSHSMLSDLISFTSPSFIMACRLAFLSVYLLKMLQLIHIKTLLLIQYVKI